MLNLRFVAGLLPLPFLLMVVAAAGTMEGAVVDEDDDDEDDEVAFRLRSSALAFARACDAVGALAISSEIFFKLALGSVRHRRSRSSPPRGPLNANTCKNPMALAGPQ